MIVTNWPYLEKEWNLSKPPTEKKTVLISRYGGIGDMFMITPFAKQLHEMGYWVSLLTTMKSWTVLLNNPYIDEIVIHERHNMLDTDLPKINGYIRQFYDHHIDTTFTVEDTLLVMPFSELAQRDRIVERRKKCNVNYLEAYQKRFTEAGFDLGLGKLEFYPDRADKRRAKKLTKKLKGKKVLLWALTGSSVHKAWPYTTNFIKLWLKNHKDWGIITTGDKTAKPFEQELKGTKNLVTTAGTLDIRTALSLIYEADLIVGPETGLMNLAGDLEIPKLLFLSHSTENNISKYWTNTTVVKTSIAQCYPCHILHNQGFKSCVKDNSTSSALCQSTIMPNEIYKKLEELI